jgi:hypothetical protein
LVSAKRALRVVGEKTLLAREGLLANEMRPLALHLAEPDKDPKQKKELRLT